MSDQADGLRRLARARGGGGPGPAAATEAEAEPAEVAPTPRAPGARGLLAAIVARLGSGRRGRADCSR